MGLLVAGFIESSEQWPLQTIGVETGDVIVSCNGEQQQLADRIVTAMRNLQEEGAPIVLVVVRAGKQVTLERAEQFPESQAGQAVE